MATILLHEKVPQAWFDELARFLTTRQPEGLRLELAQCEDGDAEKSSALLREAEVLLVGLTGQRRPVGRDAIEKAPELRLIQKVGSRATGVDLAAAREARVLVSLLPAPAHVACAEHTLLLILALARKLIPAHQQVVRRPLKETAKRSRATTASDYAHNWAALDGIGVLAGKTLGLVGMADIAIETARRARAFGMKLIYCDKEGLPENEEKELGLQRRELDDLLKEADIVSLHVARTPDTENLINAQRLALMKPAALLVNTARGGLVDEAALADALSQKRLAGAALDAWAAEPTPRDNPLLKLDNVVATPHVAAGTLAPAALFEAIAPNIIAALRGEPVTGSLTPDLAPKPPRVVPPPAEEKPQPPEASEEEDTADIEKPAGPPPEPPTSSDEEDTADIEPSASPDEPGMDSQAT